MIKLRNKKTKASLGEISQEQLDFLIDMLEEEDIEDRDYWISQLTLDYFQENGIHPALLKLLQDAIGTGEGVEIEWVSDEEKE